MKSGPSSASQTANSSANTDVSNNAETNQHQSQNQNVGGGSCLAGCGGAGGFQLGVQNAETNQAALGKADSKQNAVNANVPVSIAGGNVYVRPELGDPERDVERNDGRLERARRPTRTST